MHGFISSIFHVELVELTCNIWWRRVELVELTCNIWWRRVELVELTCNIWWRRVELVELTCNIWWRRVELVELTCNIWWRRVELVELTCNIWWRRVELVELTCNIWWRRVELVELTCNIWWRRVSSFPPSVFLALWIILRVTLKQGGSCSVSFSPHLLCFYSLFVLCHFLFFNVRMYVCLFVFRHRGVHNRYLWVFLWQQVWQQVQQKHNKYCHTRLFVLISIMMRNYNTSCCLQYFVWWKICCHLFGLSLHTKDLYLMMSLNLILLEKFAQI